MYTSGDIHKQHSIRSDFISFLYCNVDEITGWVHFNQRLIVKDILEKELNSTLNPEILHLQLVSPRHQAA